MPMPPMDTLMDWFGQTSYIEAQYEEHLTQAKDICDKWVSKGVPTLVFKGLAHSRYYPNPKHREFGDFDCYQFGKITDGNRVAAECGATVDDSWYKHSKINYKGVTIENHRYFTAARSSKKAKALNAYMVQQLGDGSYLLPLDDTNILLPTLDVEGLFMLHHSLRHFLEEGINLRHLCDWACWIKTNQKQIIWGDFYQKCREFGLDGYVDVLNVIVSRYLGVHLTFEYPQDERINALSEKVVNNTLYEDTSIHNKGRGRLYERVHLITNSLRYSWKYTEVAGYSMIGYLWEYVRGFVFREEDD